MTTELAKVSVWAVGGEPRSMQTLGHSVWHWVLDVRVVELLDSCTASVLGGHDSNSNDLNTRGTCTVTSSHVTVALCNSRSSG